MNVSLTKTLEAFVTAKIEEGYYNSASEVIRSGLRLLIEQEQAKSKSIEALNNDIEIGLKSLADKPTTTWNALKSSLNQ